MFHLRKDGTIAVTFNVIEWQVRKAKAHLKNPPDFGHRSKAWRDVAAPSGYDGLGGSPIC